MWPVNTDMILCLVLLLCRAFCLYFAFICLYKTMAFYLSGLYLISSRQTQQETFSQHITGGWLPKGRCCGLMSSLWIGDREVWGRGFKGLETAKGSNCTYVLCSYREEVFYFSGLFFRLAASTKVFMY